MSVMAAIKRLKAFRSSKATPHKQVMEIATAVQRCSTILMALGCQDELLQDQETLAEVIHTMPADSQQRWYHRKATPEESQEEKARTFLQFLEDERATALGMHLDALARKKPTPVSTSSGSTKTSQNTGGTDQGLYGGSLSTQQSQWDNPESQVHAGGTGALNRSKDTPSTARVVVKTLEEAQAVCAKRKTNLEAKNLNKCPLCKKAHTFEKSWSQLSPPIKTPMISTQLASCPLFSALSPDQKTNKITAQMTCPLCTLWEHSQHKFPGGKETSEPKCKVLVGGVACGGKHGRWFHAGEASQSNTGNLVTDTPGGIGGGSLPGLYEYYSVKFRGVPGQDQVGTLMVDNGSDTNYMQHKFVRAMGLQGEPHKCRLKVVDTDFRLVEMAKYRLNVTNIDGVEHEIVALGLESITTLPPDPDLSPLAPLLDGVTLEVLNLPQGRVDVLLGLRDSALHGRDKQQWGNLRLLRAHFGCGWALRGTHESLRFSGIHSRPSYSATP